MATIYLQYSYAAGGKYIHTDEKGNFLDKVGVKNVTYEQKPKAKTIADVDKKLKDTVKKANPNKNPIEQIEDDYELFTVKGLSIRSKSLDEAIMVAEMVLDGKEQADALEVFSRAMPI